jgi:hypothetical protein
VPVPVLQIVRVKSDVFPISTVPKARLPLSDTTLVEVDVGVGAVGLLLPQAAVARAAISTTRQSERMSGSNTILREGLTRVGPSRSTGRAAIFRLCNRSAIDLTFHTAMSARITRIISRSVGPVEPLDAGFDHSQPILLSAEGANYWRVRMLVLAGASHQD